MASFPFAVVAPEKAVFRGEVVAVSLRTDGGDIGFLAGHVPYIGAVETCACVIEVAEGSEASFAVHGGFVEMDPDGTLTLLASVIEAAGDIDVARARAAKERSSGADDSDSAAQSALARAEVRLMVSGASP